MNRTEDSVEIKQFDDKIKQIPIETSNRYKNDWFSLTEKALLCNKTYVTEASMKLAPFCAFPC